MPKHTASDIRFIEPTYEQAKLIENYSDSNYSDSFKEEAISRGQLFAIFDCPDVGLILRGADENGIWWDDVIVTPATATLAEIIAESERLDDLRALQVVVWAANPDYGGKPTIAVTFQCANTVERRALCTAINKYACNAYAGTEESNGPPDYFLPLSLS